MKLGDFGFVREEIKLFYEGKILLKVGIFYYCVLELFDEEYVNGLKKYFKKVDVWSFSIMVVEVLCGEEVFFGIVLLGGFVG